MNLDVSKILEHAALMIVGGLFTAAWSIAKKIFNMERDIDIAFQKIRELQKELDDECSLESVGSIDRADGASTSPGEGG